MTTQSRSVLGHLFSTLTAFAAVVVFCGVAWGFTGAVAVLVMRWLVGWPA